MGLGLSKCLRFMFWVQVQVRSRFLSGLGSDSLFGIMFCFRFGFRIRVGFGFWFWFSFRVWLGLRSGFRFGFVTFCPCLLTFC